MWLRARMKELNWTNQDLERASGVDNSIIWRWLSKKPRKPTPANLKKIAGPLGVSYADLMKMCYPDDADADPVEPIVSTDARRQRLFAQVDQWISAVGPGDELYLLESLAAHGQCAVQLIHSVRSAPQEPSTPVPPVNGHVPKPVRAPKRRLNGQSSAPEDELRPHQHVHVIRQPRAA